MFKSCDLTFLRDLAARTIVQVLQKGAIVVKEGDSSNEMFFVVEGEVEILSRDLGTCYDKIQAGGFFGEVGILHRWKRNATVRASSEKVILILITAKTLSNTLEAFPESIEAIAISCENRIAKAKQRNEISNAELASSQAILNIKPKQVPVIGMVYQNERIKDRQKQKNSLNSFKLNTKNFRERSISVYSEGIFNVSGHNKRVNITQCSPEELRIIFRNIRIDCKLKLRRVCKVFDQLIHEQAFWTELKFDQISRMLNSQIFFNFVGLAGDFLKVIDLSVCDTLTDDEVVVLVAECPNITHFNCSKCWKLTDKSLAAITKNLINLTILNISCCSKIRGSGFANHNIKKLLELNISYCKQISDKNVEHLLSNTPLLRTIYLNRCQRLTEFGIFLIARFCRDIEHIHVEDCEQFTDRCMKWLRSFCIKITTINFKFCRGFTSAGFKLLGDSNLNLEYLNLSFCLAVSDSTIKEFKRTFHNLKVLRLQQCSKITDSIGLHLARNAPKLQVLDIRGCPYTTSDGLQQLFESLNVQVKILSDINPEKRGIAQPGHPTKPKLQELLLSDVFLNYPKECSFRSTENIHGSITEHMNLRKFAKAKVKLAMKKDKKIEQENLIGLE
jgi:CRP-like cAMP-binding protein